MREEIRLGNEALAQQDFEAAKRCFQQLLVNGGTPIQIRIAKNRLREIQEQEEARYKPLDAKPKTSRKPSKLAKGEEAKRRFVRPPDRPLLVINKYDTRS